MPNNIQTIIDKFENEYGGIEEYPNYGSKTLVPKLKQFLKDSLTSMLDDMEKEALDKIPLDMKRSRKEVINIINSHR